MDQRLKRPNCDAKTVKLSSFLYLIPIAWIINEKN